MAMRRDWLFLAFLIASSAHAANPYVTNWFGNTYGHPDKAVPYTTKSILLAPNGDVLLNTRSSEQVYVHQIYGPDGNWKGKYNGEKKGGNAICADATHFYFNLDEDTGLTLIKGRLSDYGKVSQATITTIGELVAMTCANGKVYLSDEVNRKVFIRNTSDLSAAGELNISGQVATPGAIAGDAAGNIWLVDIVDNDVHCYDASGVHEASKTITSVARPVALAADLARNLLFVADTGPDYNIKVFDISGAAPVLAETIGVSGGVYEGTTTKGTLGPLRFNGFCAMSVNSAGNLAVNCPGVNVWRGTEIRWLRRNGGTWEETAMVRGDHFVDSGDIDDHDETLLFSMDLKYTMDYSKPAGQGWKAVAVTTDPFAFPHDPRNWEGNKVIGITMRHIQGQRFIYASSEDDRLLMIYRFDPENYGEIGIPCGLQAHNYIADMDAVWGSAQPVTQGQGRWMWVDQNADGTIQRSETSVLGPAGGAGYSVDKEGTIWFPTNIKVGGVKRSQLYGVPLESINAGGVPVYDEPANPVPTVDPMREITYAVYNPDTDVMVQFGETADKPFTDGFSLIRAAIRYDNWASGAPTTAWLYDQFQTNDLGAIHHVYAEDDYMLAGRRDGYIQVHRMSDAQQIIRLEAGPEVQGTAGKLDHGPALLRAQKRSNGEYVVLVEEDGWCKLLLYQWLPPHQAFSAGFQAYR